MSDTRGNPINGRANPNATPAGYGPTTLRAAYGTTNYVGTGTPTIAIVNAYGYANAEKDLATYRSTFGLPACTSTSGCFKKVNQSGGTNLPRAGTEVRPGVSSGTRRNPSTSRRRTDRRRPGRRQGGFTPRC